MCILLTTSTWSWSSLVPRLSLGRERVWNPLFTHALNLGKLCVISVQTWRHNVYSPLYRLYNDGSILIIRSPAPSSSLRQLVTSDMSLKKLQVTTSLGFAWKNTCLYSYCLRDTTVLPFVIDCKLPRTYCILQPHWSLPILGNKPKKIDIHQTVSHQEVHAGWTWD